MSKRRACAAAAALVFAIAPLASKADVVRACGQGAFCAGAAGADITPPVTTPMWGYTARQGADWEGGNTGGFEDAAGGLTAADVSAFVSGLRTQSNDELIHDKTHPDADRYDKTFVSNRGIHLRLFANAFVLQGTDGKKVAIVQTDLGGLPAEVHQGVANRLVADGVGVDRDHLLIGATHTHHGPGGIFQYQGYALLGGDEFDPRVFEAVVGGITRAIERANAALSPAAMAWGQLSTTGANRNRRTSPQWCLDPENKCDDALHPVAGQSPPSNDPLLTMIRLDRADGVPIGAITNFAAHGTIGGEDNLLFSGDNQGWATRLIEDGIAAEYGKPLPPGWRVVDALVNGAQGDQSPVGDSGPYDWQGSVNRQYAEMEDAGRRQLAPALALWKQLGGSMRSDVTVDARAESLCFCGQQIDDDYVYDGPKIDKSDPMWNHVSAYAALGYGGVIGDDGTTSPVVLPGQGNKLPVLGGAGTNPSITRLMVMRVGDLAIASVPGEPTVTSGRRIKASLLALDGREAAYSAVIVAGLGNDYDSYFATPEEYSAAQYEGGFTLFGPQSVPLLQQELSGLAARMIAGAAMPDCASLSDPAFCATHMDHPDTSATSIEPTPFEIDAAPAIVSQPQATLSRFNVAEMTWIGGGPSAEWRPDQDRVEVQRLIDGQWTTVYGDAHDAATLLRYDKTEQGHTWTAQWDIARDQAPGTYRLHIQGAYATAPATRTPYTLDSRPFEVRASQALRVFVTRDGDAATVLAGYPLIDGQRNYRLRPRLATGGTAYLDIVRAGSGLTLTSPVDSSGSTTFNLQPGDTIAGARVIDEFGNAG